MTERQDPEHLKAVTPSKEVVSDAYGDILKHNKEHTGFGALLGNVMKTVLKDVRADVQVSDDIVAEGDMDAALQDIFHNDTFTRIGIKAAQFGEYSTDLDGTAVTSKEIVPIIDNPSLFTEFLGTLKPEDTHDKQLGKLLADVVANLNKLVELSSSDDAVATMSDDERAQITELGLDALRTFLAFDDEYARLKVDSTGLTNQADAISDELKGVMSARLQYKVGGLSPDLREEYQTFEESKRRAKSYTSLARKVGYWGRDILAEGIIADKNEYLTPPSEQGFGPTNWHKDGGQRHWTAALAFLTQLQQSERTQEFGAEVQTGLLASIDAALAEIETAEEELYYSGQKADLINLRAAVNGDEYDVEKLMSYTEPPDYLKYQ